MAQMWGLGSDLRGGEGSIRLYTYQALSKLSILSYNLFTDDP